MTTQTTAPQVLLTISEDRTVCQLCAVAFEGFVAMSVYNYFLVNRLPIQTAFEDTARYSKMIIKTAYSDALEAYIKQLCEDIGYTFIPDNVTLEATQKQTRI